MGKRDIERREAKKPKKGLRKPAVIAEFAPSPVVEVVRKKRKEDEEAED